MIGGQNRNMLENLQPKEVFTFFEEICQIPHGSGNTKQISDYLVKFAKDRNLEYIQDELNNVIMIKEATEGYETEEPIIIQGHMDMVAVKEADCPIDMEKDGLELIVSGDDVYAKGTSLGGDDGIAVAYALALLDSDSIPHPRLEVVITVDEEVGMDGALFIDLSMLKGKKLLNIDSEKQGELTVSCAGGVRVNGCFSHVFEKLSPKAETVTCKLEISGLTGGHSGVEIHHGRANANMLLGNLLYDLNREVHFVLVSIQGGTKDNVIPSNADAEFVLDKNDYERMKELVSKREDDWKEKFKTTDSGLKVAVTTIDTKEEPSVVRTDVQKNILNFLNTAKNGVQAMCEELPDLVETSLNLGVIRTNGENIDIAFSLRSSKKDSKVELSEAVCDHFKQAGAEVELTADYPAWELKKDSKLVGQMCELYEEMFGEKPIVLSIHAGLECGVLADKIEGLDSVSFGPNLYDIHTTKERLSISSTKQMWDYLVALVQKKEA